MKPTPKCPAADPPVAKYVLFLGGSADVEWCDKHASALNTAVKKTANRLQVVFQKVMRLTRMI